jgi:branched-chain amino acid aminotransferase
MVQDLARPAKLAKGAAPDTAWAYLGGKFVPVREAKISVMTHAFNYGTGVFEGVRAYWNAEEEQLYGLHFREHYKRLLRSCKIMRLTLPHSVEDLVDITIELLRKCGYREDAYIRPVVFKSSELIGVRLHNLEDSFTVFAVPFGNYVNIEGGISVQVSSWRRVDDNAMPARGKLTGAYINTALAVDEVAARGADEAIFLTNDGHISEGGGANLFVVRDETLVTTPVTADILEGITRECLMALARERGLRVVERPIDRTELYVAEEVFFSGTGAQVAPCVSIDGRPVGSGRIGPVAQALAERYFAIARGDDPAHPEWREAVYR